MRHKEIFKRLSTTAPGRLKFEIANDDLFITIHENDIIEGNMQTNNSAFESWMLIIKSSSEFSSISKVILQWKPITPPSKDGHYNRFMYRVMKCIEYFSWFSVADKNKDEVAVFQVNLKKDKLILNYPENNATKVAANQNSEAAIERKFEEKGNLFYGKTFKDYGQQLPVGVFKSVKKKDTGFFTKGHSAIDLWGISNGELWLFELKFNNKMIGIITETLFYMWLCEDVFINHSIKYDIIGSIPKYRNFDKIYDLYKNGAKSIVGVFLYDNENIHHMIKKWSVVEYINTQLQPNNLKIECQSYNYDISLNLCKSQSTEE